MRLPVRSLCLALLSLWGAAHAASPLQGTTTAQASVANTCLIQSSDSLSFGAYNPTSGLASTGSTQVRLVCTKGAAYVLSATSGGSQMRGAGGQVLNYGLYADAGMTQVFGAGAATTLPLSINANAPTYNVFSSIKISAADFAANPAYAQQAYFHYANQTYTNGTLTATTNEYYLIGYQGQTNTLPGTGLAGVNSISGHVLVATNPYAGAASDSSTTGNVTTKTYRDIILPPGTAIVGGVYAAPTGGAAGIKGTATSSKSVIGLAVYGKVPASQDLPPGSFSDNVVLTLTF